MSLSETDMTGARLCEHLLECRALEETFTDIQELRFA